MQLLQVASDFKFYEYATLNELISYICRQMSLLIKAYVRNFAYYTQILAGYLILDLISWPYKQPQYDDASYLLKIVLTFDMQQMPRGHLKQLISVVKNIKSDYPLHKLYSNIIASQLFIGASLSKPHTRGLFCAINHVQQIRK